MRASVRRHLEIDVAPDAVWAVVSRAQLLHLWFPGVVTCTMADQVRTVTLGTGLKLKERVVTCDPIQRRFQYRIEGGLFQEHLATLDVLEIGDRSLVVYATDADPATMAVVMGGAMGAALEELSRQLLAGDGPAVLAAAEAPPPEVVGGTVGAVSPLDPSATTIASGAE